ncbi:related to short chain oxidoreductase/dehydrogenase [Phialocephala subalpina]|uniref:Related to short chain oxidoreductase/dehydrogenase n=1 Tax=Phialocephala subalpina TaxID=576137 RepID=A0A1L7X9N7_9HELO|nr:related to short chain oxidoreductase/dehydrogenase [Phialocephala subalpina]
MSQVWLITGSSSGFGFSLARIALRAGHKVIATSRNPSKTPKLVSEIESLGGKWLALNVCDPNIADVIEHAVAAYGQIDVLVNNAGYSLLGALEDMSDSEVRAQMETNFFAPVKITQLLLPSMRARKNGTIVNISSVGGISALPTNGLYASSKFALEGMLLFLSTPGGFRTNFLNSYVTTAKPLTKDYEGTIVENVLKLFSQLHGKQGGDVEKGCQAIFDVVTGTGSAAGKERMLRLPLGTDAAGLIRQKAESLIDMLDKQEDIWSKTNVVEDS